MCLCTLNPLKSRPLQFKCDFATLVHSKRISFEFEWIFLLSNIPLHSHINSKHLQYSQASTTAFNQLDWTFNCMKYAFNIKNTQCNTYNFQMCNCTPLISKSPNPKWPTNAPSTQRAQKSLSNTSITQDPLPNN